MSPITQTNKTAQAIAHSIPVLGVTIGENRWLIPMHDIKEILPVPTIIPVFLTQPWFLGIINAHGNIYGLCDLGRYLGKQPASINAKTRALLIAPRLGRGYAMLAENILGIRDLTEFSYQADQESKQSTIVSIYADRQNRLWQMLNLPVLMQLNSFLQVSR